jgi:hypothetical protein
LIDLRLDREGGCGPVRCDPNQLHNAVLSLAINAREGFPPSVIEAVGALTKKIIDGTEEPYEEFIRRAAQNPKVV